MPQTTVTTTSDRYHEEKPRFFDRIKGNTLFVVHVASYFVLLITLLLTAIGIFTRYWIWIRPYYGNLFGGTGNVYVQPGYSNGWGQGGYGDFIGLPLHQWIWKDAEMQALYNNRPGEWIATIVLVLIAFCLELLMVLVGCCLCVVVIPLPRITIIIDILASVIIFACLLAALIIFPSASLQYVRNSSGLDATIGWSYVVICFAAALALLNLIFLVAALVIFGLVKRRRL